jgi:hypothetical protein
MKFNSNQTLKSNQKKSCKLQGSWNLCCKITNAPRM